MRAGRPGSNWKVMLTVTRNGDIYRVVLDDGLGIGRLELSCHPFERKEAAAADAGRLDYPGLLAGQQQGEDRAPARAVAANLKRAA